MLQQDADTLDREGILALQQKGLAGMGQRLARCETWRAHFAKAGMKPEDLASVDGLAHAPMMEKSLLRDHYPFPFLTVPMEQVERFVATSGTTAKPKLTVHTHGPMDHALGHVSSE